MYHKIKPLMFAALSFLFVIGPYLFLCSQSENAKFGVFLTIVFLGQYAILYLVLSYLQPWIFLSPILGLLNGVLLFLLQIDRESSGSWGIWFEWDWMLGTSILMLAVANFIVSVVLIIVFAAIKGRERKAKFESNETEAIPPEIKLL